jgi:hypothetical protein
MTAAPEQGGVLSVPAADKAALGTAVTEGPRQGQGLEDPALYIIRIYFGLDTIKQSL